MALASIALTAFGKLESKDFFVLASAAFTYYFTKSTPSNGDPNQ